MPIVAEQYAFVIGVDTHAATHSFALINATNGGIIGQAVFPTSPACLDRACTWINPGPMRVRRWSSSRAPVRSVPARLHSNATTAPHVGGYGPCPGWWTRDLWLRGVGQRSGCQVPS